MPSTPCIPFRNFCASTLAAVFVAASPHAGATLHVYEPFDYPAASLLQGTTATGLNLTGTYTSDAVHQSFQLSMSAPGSSYGNLAGAPSATGSKLTQLNGTIPVGSRVELAEPLVIPPGQAIFFSALFTFDDTRNGNHFASIDLIDDSTGDAITFGQSVVGVRAIRASATTLVTGGQITTVGDENAFDDGQTLLLIGRYNNSAAALGDRLELLGYDTAASHELPTSFDPSDPDSVLYQELAGVDIDLMRISSLRFTVRGIDNNFIDELRIGSTLADVAPIPEPHAWLLLTCGLATAAAAARARRQSHRSTRCGA